MAAKEALTKEDSEALKLASEASEKLRKSAQKSLGSLKAADEMRSDAVKALLNESKYQPNDYANNMNRKLQECVQVYKIVNN